MNTQDYHSGRRRALDDSSGGFDAVEQGHPDVHDDHIGLEGGGESDGVTAILGFAGNFQITLALQQRAQSSAHNRVIVSKENAPLLHAGTLC
jgi:hypothetical protein